MQVMATLVCAKVICHGAPPGSENLGGLEFVLPRSTSETPEDIRSVLGFLGGLSWQWLNPLLSVMRNSVILQPHQLRFE